LRLYALPAELQEQHRSEGIVFNWKLQKTAPALHLLPLASIKGLAHVAAALSFCKDKATMKVFVTGATGFVGHHVARELAAQGADLRLLVRKTSNLPILKAFGGETHVGDLATRRSIRPALEGCDAVMHVAADYRLWIPDPKAMYRANVDGTRELLRWRAKRACGALSTHQAWRPWAFAPMA
jgi:FlaA1/EpsC-like NDP-sugar epimerase